MTVNEYLLGAEDVENARIKIQTYRSDYLRIKNTITTDIFRVGNDMIIAVRIGSAKVNAIKYDVVLQFDDLYKTSGRTIGNMEFRAFSNSPSFVYSYANIFMNLGLMCEWLYDKYSNEVQSSLPHVRNTSLTIAVERSLYTALYHLQTMGQFAISALKALASVSTLKEIASTIHSQQDTESGYKQEVAIARAKAREEKKANNLASSSQNQSSPTVKKAASAKATSKTQKTQSTKGVKRTRHF